MNKENVAYKLFYTPDAESDIRELIKSGNKASILKLQKLLIELMEHPETGTGKPHPMKYGFSGCWSRRIDHKNRLIYVINNDIVTVTVLSALGHYDDK